ncbi:hypothetical protein DNTS_033952 [Danionella cerebrum]|uniref:Uncharacterized protein n=1 Tax=Danionella cerebrum TaxID=2873325 RepID=A0A553RC80_9TELE|nr:hypothetical protein DNTS_033952 [Danionella translucida]
MTHRNESNIRFLIGGFDPVVIVIRTGSPSLKNITIAYKFKKSSYKASGAAFTESCSIGPGLSSVGVFYDDPNQTPADQCRYIVGSILCENKDKPDQELQNLYEKFGYKIISFPEVSCAVTSSFPNRCSLSPVCGAYRVYPEIQQYIKGLALVQKDASFILEVKEDFSVQRSVCLRNSVYHTGIKQCYTFDPENVAVESCGLSRHGSEAELAPLPAPDILLIFIHLSDSERAESLAPTQEFILRNSANTAYVGSPIQAVCACVCAFQRVSELRGSQ